MSIIMPAYKAESTIVESIESVIRQTYHHWELLIADDNSLDGTTSIVKSFSGSDFRIRLISSTLNTGPALARNRALQQASGRWIAFLDSDDVWFPTKLADTIEYATRTNSALTFTGYRRFLSEDGRTGRFIHVPQSLSYFQLLRNTAIATSTVLVDTQITGPLLMKDVYYDDFACWLDILRRGFLAHGLNSDLMRYRVLPKSVSRNKLRSAVEVWRIYRISENLSIANSFISFLGYFLFALIKYRSL